MQYLFFLFLLIPGSVQAQSPDSLAKYPILMVGNDTIYYRDFELLFIEMGYDLPLDGIIGPEDRKALIEIEMEHCLICRQFEDSLQQFWRDLIKEKVWK